MNDRELLELAAKAAGYNVRWHDRWECFVHAKPHNIDNPPTMAGQRMVWAPLNDDGDALRLAVKLKLQVIIYSDWVEVLQDGIRKSNADSAYDAGCMLNCTRRAITRAAAEIGRGME